MQPIVVFCHLRWNFVYQRPQHLMTRIARHRPVYFIEEPVLHAGPEYMQVSTAAPNLFVCTPHSPVAADGFHDDQLTTLRRLIRELSEERALRGAVAWLYTPMALPLVRTLEPTTLVYDCMDELSMFRNAPRKLLLRERALLKAADVVFTGGTSLYRSKRALARQVFCFPSSVEREHFASSQDARQDHPQQAHVPRPRLGFYGVIDERLDIELLTELADARPEWNLMMVGPVVKIDPASLPVRPNIHYFGQRDYAELPRFLAGWDVCLLPFALNDATRFISPTKTLEYMAADKPIVSTPITDVVESFSEELVQIGATPLQFIAACERVLGMSAQQMAQRRSGMREVIARTSWDSTAAKMLSLIEECVVRKPLRGSLQGGVSAVQHVRNRARVAIIGAGPTGLSAAYHVGEDAMLFEQHGTVGGWCRSIEDRGFTFDYAGHIMFSNDPSVHELYRTLLGDNVHWQDREAWIYSKGVYTRYPFQGALYGLPHHVVRECIVGAIEARFGALKASVPQAATRARAENGSGAWACKAESITDCCADGVTPLDSLSLAEAPRSPKSGAPANFEEFIYAVWGRGIAKHFAVPYNRKLWSVPLSEMETSWLGGRVPLPDLEELIEGALHPAAKPMGPNARFGYPLRGGFQALMDGFLPHLRGRLRLHAQVTRVSPANHTLRLADDSEYEYEQLISTMPLPRLVQLMGAEAPAVIQNAVKQLRHVSVRCVNLGIGREQVTDKHWIYYPEDSVFHRIFVQGNASPHVNPPGGFGLTCEITYSPHKPLPCEGDALIERCIEDCRKVGIIRADDSIIARNQLDMPYAYVVYDHARAHNVELIRSWLARNDILLAGRYSEWEYYNSDHAFIAGRKAAEQALAALEECSQPVAAAKGEAHLVPVRI